MLLDSFPFLCGEGGWAAGRGGGYKNHENHVKIAKQTWKHIFSVQPSGFVLND